jgi:hypothetical protein
VLVFSKEEMQSIIPEGPNGLLWKDFKAIYEEKGKKKQKYIQHNDNKIVRMKKM